MKRIITLALSIIFTMSAYGQRLEYDQTSKWFFGLNAGATWNTTDVQNKTYAGWGFLFGRSYNYDYGRKFSFDLRMRYLRGKWYGQDTDSTNLSHLGTDYNGALSDYKNQYGYGVNNFEANVHELGLELVIHANRFRDRTGWDPYIFGGVNVVWNETYGDLINQANLLAFDTLYQYDQIGMNKPDIEFVLDNDYESNLDGTDASKFNVDFMPSLGIGLGYDFGPRFSMGIEHKTTFALKDDFDGYTNDEPQWGFLKNDVYHYTSAYLTWRFRGRGNVGPTPTPQPDPNPVITGTTNTPCQFPEVRTTKPLQRTETVQTQGYVFRAEVNFVQSRNEIVMTVNGIETTNFLYNPDTHQLESYLNLQAGNNTIVITARNTCGTDSETSTIIFNNCIDPVVYFENVCSNTSTAQVEQQSYTVQAQISNATSVEFTVNGIRSTNFTYNSTTGQFRSNILLNSGQNNIRITAISACGTATGTSVVTYTDCADPLVNFANGNNGFVSVSQRNFNLSAYVYNIVKSSNVTVRLNGSIQTFNLNTSTSLLTASLVLNQGQNTIQIVAANNCGSDTETLTIEYTPCVDPSIQMMQPLAQSTTTTNGTQVVKAMLNNVASMNQIQLFVNGNLQQGGSYNAVTRMFEASVALNSGFNTIQITVINDCGSDTETISVNYNPCSTPDVQLILPSANGSQVSSPSQLVQAMVFNVNNISEIKTYVNGAMQSGGTYTSVNGLYQITVGLALGVNTIQVVATNSCGSDVQTITVTYRACEAPVINFTAPNTNPFYTNATNMNVSATVSGIASASQVQLTVNGILDASGATYNSGSFGYNNNVALNPGNNVIRISTTNSCGTVTKEINVIREIVVVNTPGEDIDSIVICFVHSNNVGDPITLTIPLSSWPAYQSQGALLGPCPVVVEPIDLPMTICFTISGTPTTIEILTSEWPAYQALGATQGACPVQTMSICFNNNQLTIPVTQWNLYQSQGATEGPCPIVVEETIIICHKINGDPTNTETIEIPLSEWAAHQAHGDVLGPCPTVDPEMVICLNGNQMTILTSQWSTFQAQGATQGPCPVIIDEPITICVMVNNVQTTMTILTSQWAAYQAQGATQGPCPVVVDEPMTICMVVNGVRTTLTILTSEWPTYQAQGAMQGPCPSIPDPQITICMDVNGVPTTMSILSSEWATYQAQGATLGACVSIPDPSIPICLNGVAMTILTSELPTYIAQGATEGPCPVIVDEPMTICMVVNDVETTMTILTSEWATYQAQGATLGACPVVVDEPMTICMVVNGVRTTLTILTSEWPTYQAQGAMQGPCPSIPDPQMTICWVDASGVPTTLSILTSEWAGYQAQGATMGACVSIPDPSIPICLNGVAMTILTSELPSYLAQGATEGPCPVIVDEPMTICMVVNDVETTMTILTSEWATYQAQGATLGACPVVVDPLMTICINVNGVRSTIEIPTSEWPTYQAQGARQGACPTVVDNPITICMDVNGVPTTMTILTSEWATYQAQGASLGECIVTVDPLIPICVNGKPKTIRTSELPSYLAQGATEGPCPVSETITICFNGAEMQIPLIALGEYLAQGAVEGPCPVAGMMTICLNGVEMQIPREEWSTYQSQGATQGNCPLQSMTICFNGKTLEIGLSEWNYYQGRGAKMGACVESPNAGGTTGGSGDSLNINNGRPTNGGGNEDELLFGNSTITICHTPNGSISSQTMQIPMNEWEQYQLLGATLGACAGSVPTGGGGTIDVNNNGTGSGNGVGGVPINPNGTGGTPPTGGGNLQQVGNGSQEAIEAKKAADEAKRKAAEAAAAEKVRQEQAAKDAAAKKLADEAEAKRKAAQQAADEKARQEQAVKDAAAKKLADEAEAKRKAAQQAADEKARQEKAVKDAAAEKVRQEQAAKDAAAKKLADEAEAKRKAVQQAADEKARQEQAVKDAAAEKVRQEQAAKDAAAKKLADQEEAKRKAAQQAAADKARQEQAAKDAAAKKAAQEEAARRQAEEAKRKAAQDAAAAKARQEQAAKDAAAKKAAAEAAKRKADQEAAAAKARQEQAAKEAAAKKAAADDAKRKADAAAKEAAAKKAAEEAAKKKVEEQRKSEEKEGGR